MGVKHLWGILDSVKEKKGLDYMRGQVLCIDLSIWIVEAKKTLEFVTSVKKPHLRNLLFRVLSLRRLGVKLVFVTEGKPPDLKQNTMRQRNNIRYKSKATSRKGNDSTVKKVNRSRFQAVINECCQLLDLLGVPHVKAAGEAEAMCAKLSKEGLVDGCITNDGDTFLYGAKLVYRDLGIDPKDPHILRYDISDIHSRLNLKQEDMVGLALLSGCDYTDGVKGVGKTLIHRFLEERHFDEDLLQRLDLEIHYFVILYNMDTFFATVCCA